MPEPSTPVLATDLGDLAAPVTDRRSLPARRSIAPGQSTRH
jgi:hypothetical protein